MAAIASAGLIVEFERTVLALPPVRITPMLRRVTALLPGNADRLNPRRFEIFDAIQPAADTPAIAGAGAV